jgi:hypothetical protein
VESAPLQEDQQEEQHQGRFVYDVPHDFFISLKNIQIDK